MPDLPESLRSREGEQIMTTSFECLDDYEEDDILWATETGELEGNTKPYCVECAPEQPNYEERVG